MKAVYRQDTADNICDKGTDHVDFAMGKIDQLNDAVDHSVAKGDQGIDTAPRQATEK